MLIKFFNKTSDASNRTIYILNDAHAILATFNQDNVSDYIWCHSTVTFEWEISVKFGNERRQMYIFTSFTNTRSKERSTIITKKF